MRARDLTKFAVVLAVGLFVFVRWRWGVKDEAPGVDSVLSNPNDIALTTTGEATKRADKTMGLANADTSRELEPLPKLEKSAGETLTPGSALQPATFLRIEARPLGVVTDAYAAMWKEHSGDYDTLVHASDGWHRVLDRKNGVVEDVEEIALMIDIVNTVRFSTTPGDAVDPLRAGAIDLARRLNARVEREIDGQAIRDRMASLLRARNDADAAIDARLVALDRPYVIEDIHRIARQLGFVRSDFGSYGWYNETGIGSDYLLTIWSDKVKGSIGFDSADPKATYPAFAIGFNVDDVPLPEVVIERLLTAIAAFRTQLGGNLTDVNGAAITEDSLRSHVRQSVKILASTGLLVDAHMAN